MPFHGVTAAAITPRGKGGSDVDLGAALEIIDFLCAAGVSGIELLGTAGEFPNLGSDSRSRLTYMAVKRSRVPVLVGVSHSALEDAIALGREAAYAGAAGLLLMPPYFYRCHQPEIREFYTRFAEQMPQGVPLFLEHAPAYASPIERETAAALLSAGRFAGIKDSGGDPAYLELLHDQPSTLLVGDDASFPHTRAHGVISAAASAVPELILGLNRSLAAGDRAATAHLEARLREFLGWMAHFPTPFGIKEAIAARGLKVGPPAIPPACETQRRLDEFRGWFRSWLTVVRKETQ